MISWFRVKGQSMEPFAKEGDFAFICSFLKPKIGDVAVFKHEGKFLLKRIKKIEGAKYWIEGDNKNWSLDSRHFGWALSSQALGKTFLVHKTGV